MSKKDVFYKDVDDAYRRLFSRLELYARINLIEKDNSIDAVNDAFVKVLEWEKRNPGGHISRLVIFRKVLQACRSMNRRQRMVSIHDPAFSAYFRTEINGQKN